MLHRTGALRHVSGRVTAQGGFAPPYNASLSHTPSGPARHGHIAGPHSAGDQTRRASTRRDLARSAGAATVVVASLLFAAPAMAASTLNVSTTGTDSGTCGPTADPCLTVQQAVDNAASGDTISIGFGVFKGQVVVGGSKTLTLVGQGRSSTSIAATDTQLPTTFTQSTGSVHRPIVLANTGSAVTLRHLTVDGRGKLAPNSGERFDGVAFNAADGTLDDVRVTRMRDAPFSGAQSGVGVVADAASVAHTVTIQNSRVDDFQKNGLTLNGSTLTANVTGSVVQGQGPTGTIAQNGIQVSNGAAATISGNDVSGQACAQQCSGGSSSTGMLLVGSGAVTVSANKVHDNDVQVYDIGVPNLTATGNTFSGAGQDGILVDSDSPEVPTTATITGNQFLGQDAGIGVFDEDTGSGPSPTVTAHLNRFVGNTFGIDSNAAMNAEDNWWGCNTGPNTAGCDTTSNTLPDANPWLTFRVTASPASIEAGGAQSTILGRVDQDSNGGAVTATAFPASPVAFTTTLGNIDASADTNGGAAKSRLSSGDTTGTATVTGTLDNQSATTRSPSCRPRRSAGPAG